MFKDLSMRIFLAHLVTYVAITAIAAAINLWLVPGTLWWPWVLIGWGVAVAIHAFALLLRKTRRRERIFIDRKARALAVHLFGYVAVVLVLLFVNLALTPKVWWFYWVALGWGAGVAFHGWCTFFRRRPKQHKGVSAQPQPEQVQSERVKGEPKPVAKSEAEPPAKKSPRKRSPAKRKPKA
jgi:predicted membrane channel-forming protein YqfA (hemolysin III family)